MEASVEPVVAVAVEEAVPKVNRPGTFVSGDPRAWPIEDAKAGKKKEKPLADYVPVDEGVVGTLADMQHVYRNTDARHDKTGGQRFQREFAEKSRGAFLAEMKALEKQVVREEAAKTEEEDEGTQRCIELCEKLIAELTKGE